MNITVLPDADRRGATRARLLEAARSLFVEVGYHATRPQDIARRAGIGHGTFYLHFHDKQACFLAFAEDARQELEEFLRARRARRPGAEAQIRALLEALLDHAEAHPGVLRAAMSDLAVISGDTPAPGLLDRWAASFVAGLAPAIAAGSAHADYNLDLLGHLLIGTLRGVMHARLTAGRTDLVDTATLFLLRVLRPDGVAAADNIFLTYGA